MLPRAGAELLELKSNVTSSKHPALTVPQSHGWNLMLTVQHAPTLQFVMGSVIMRCLLLSMPSITAVGLVLSRCSVSEPGSLSSRHVSCCVTCRPPPLPTEPSAKRRSAASRAPPAARPMLSKPLKGAPDSSRAPVLRLQSSGGSNDAASGASSASAAAHHWLRLGC